MGLIPPGVYEFTGDLTYLSDLKIKPGRKYRIKEIATNNSNVCVLIEPIGWRNFFNTLMFSSYECEYSTYLKFYENWRKDPHYEW